jgi:hypothetical protein
MLRRALPILVLLFAAPSFGTTDVQSAQTLRGAANDLLGYRMAGEVDADGDAIPDVAIGAPSVGFRTAEVSLWRGNANGVATTPSVTLNAAANSPAFGENLATGDVNGDGRRDLIIADPNFDGRRGRVVVYFATPQGITAPPSLILDGGGGGTFGASLATGDLDGDGDDDLVVGSPLVNGNAGQVDVFFGTPTGPVNVASQTFAGAVAEARLGSQLAFADVDGDGAADLLVSADGRVGQPTQVTVHSGGVAGLDATPALTLQGALPASGFGALLARVGDTDLDGFDDVAIWSGADAAGAVSIDIYHGSAAGLSASPAVSIVSQPHLSGNRGLFAGLEDANGDGFADLAVVDSDLALTQSVARVYFGGPTGIDPTAAWRLLGTGPTALLQSVISLGDVNSDGLTDLAAAAPSAGTNRGEVYTVLGAVDSDRDGWAVRGTPSTDDCDDSDPLLGEPTAFYVDGDGDGHGDGAARWACTAPAGSVPSNDDCNDADPLIGPHQSELCDTEQVDEDCDGLANDRDPNLDPAIIPTWYIDVDGDGFGDASNGLVACNQPAGRIDVGGDCDETRVRVNPGAAEVCDYNNVDDDCDGTADDADDSVDVTTMVSRFADADRDGFGDAATIVRVCDPSGGLVTDSTDCDDTRDDVSPEGIEVCGVGDEDCDGLEDDADPSLAEEGRAAFFVDIDGDGYGGDDIVTACLQPAEAATNTDDCNDRNALTYPGASDGPNRADYDCDEARCSSVPGPARWIMWIAAAAALRRRKRS